MRMLRFVGTIVLTVASVTVAGDRLAWRTQYDAQGRLVQTTDPAERVTRFTWTRSDRGNSVTRTPPEGSPVTWHFNHDGLLASMRDAQGEVQYRRDRIGRLEAVERQGAPTIRFAYLASGDLAQQSVGDFYRLTWKYDHLGRVVARETPAGTIRYEYWTGQNTVVRILPNGVKTFWKHRLNGEIQEITHGFFPKPAENSYEVLARYQYSFAADGRVATIGEASERGDVRRDFGYDLAGRLTSTTVLGRKPQRYEYDQLGNRTRALNVAGADQLCVSDWAGRLSSIDGVPCTHDGAGNLSTMTLSGEKREYHFAPDGRLSTATIGNRSLAYGYDGLGYLASRKDEAETRFVADPLSPAWHPLVTERANRRTLVVWDGQLPLAIVRNGKAEWLLHDHLGSVRLVVNGAGKVVAERDYDSFGVPQAARPLEDETFGFAGLYWDAPAGVYLTQTRAYVCELGRWLQPDPVQSIPIAGPAGIAAYAYCESDPINLVDLDGAEPQASTGLWQALGEGRYLGTGYGDEAVAYWAQRWAQTGNALFAVPGLFASLWTPDTWLDTASVISGARALRGAAQLTTGDLMLSVRQFLWDPRRFSTVSRDYHSAYRAIHGVRGDFELDHLLIPQSWRHVPQGLRNAGFNLLELPNMPGIFHHSLTLNQWMGFAPRWGKPMTTLAAEGTHWGIRGAVGLGMTGAAKRGWDLGTHVNTGLESMGRNMQMGPSPVGGVYLAGAGKVLEGLGAPLGITQDQNGTLMLIFADKAEVRLPPLRLDDMVTVFRSVYLHGQGPTITIDPDPRNPEGLPMLVVHGNGTENTYVGWVLYQADRLMKSHTQGVDNVTGKDVVSGVEGFKDMLDSMYFGQGDPGQAQKNGVWERFWIVPARIRRYECESEKSALLDLTLKVRTQKMKWDNGKLVDDVGVESSIGATKFAKWFTANYDDIGREQLLPPPPETGIEGAVPVFAELRRIALMTAIAEKLRDEGTPMPFWMRDYPVKHVPVDRTTPGLKVERKREEGNVTRTASIFGGVALSSDPQVVTTYSAADVARLPVRDRAHLQQSLKQAAELESGVARAVAGTEGEYFEVRPLRVQGAAYQVVALPGASTVALGARRLEQVDLELPLGDAGSIALVRHYHSFFACQGPWGRGWSWGLPRLEAIRVPVIRDGRAEGVSTGYELITPHNQYHARFSRLQKVAALGNATLLVPDTPGAFQGVADDKPAFLNSVPTRVVLVKNGQRWHFAHEGTLVAVEDGPMVTVYEQEGGRVTAIAGSLGGMAAARIDLHYAADGLLSKATGRAFIQPNSKAVEVNYEYDLARHLVRAMWSEGSREYSYERDWVASVTAKSSLPGAAPLFQAFEYDTRGRVISEHNGAERIHYQIAADATGASVTQEAERLFSRARRTKPFVLATSVANADVNLGGLPSQRRRTKPFVRCGTGMRPVAVGSASGATATWAYPAGGGVRATVDDGARRISLTESHDRRERIVSVDDVTFVAQFNDAERMLSLNIAGDATPLLNQTWRTDGQPARLDIPGSRTEFFYGPDAVLSLVRTRSPDNEKASVEWRDIKLDRLGNPVEVKDHSGLILLMEYDTAGRLVSAAQKTTNGVVGFKSVRRADGRLLSVDSSWGKVSCQYDAKGELQRIESHRSGKNASAEFYAGRIQRMTALDGGTTTFEYAEGNASAGQLLLVTCPLGLELRHRYEKTRLRGVRAGSQRNYVVECDQEGRVTAVIWEQEPEAGPQK